MSFRINKHLTCSIGLRSTVAVTRLQAAAAQIRGKARVPLDELVGRDTEEERDEGAIVLMTGIVIVIGVAI